MCKRRYNVSSTHQTFFGYDRLSNVWNNLLSKSGIRLGRIEPRKRDLRENGVTKPWLFELMTWAQDSNLMTRLFSTMPVWHDFKKGTRLQSSIYTPYICTYSLYSVFSASSMMIYLDRVISINLSPIFYPSLPHFSFFLLSSNPILLFLSPIYVHTTGCVCT